MTKRCASHWRVAILMTCFNRVDATLAGLKGLYETLQNCQNLEFRIYLVDDGSPDNTGKRVSQEFPDVVVVKGTGSLYWNRGMCLAYQSSLPGGLYDAYIMFNDDVELIAESAISSIECFRTLNKGNATIVVGATQSRIDGNITYSGFRETAKYRALSFEMIPPSFDRLLACDTFNGNWVILPGDFFRSIGGLDPIYRHSLGDIDLGLVARRMNLDIVIFNKVIGYCERGPTIDDKIKKMSIFDRIRAIFLYPYGIAPYAHFVWKNRPRLLFVIYCLNFIASGVKRVLCTERRA